MRVRAIIRVATALSAIWAASSAGLENPLGSPTVPPTHSEEGLVRNPVSGYYSQSLGNMIVTGNITGGKYFRGVVPYRAPTDFEAPMGSAALRDFLRDSAGIEYTTRAPGVSEPYYLPSQTVSKIRRDTESGLEAPVIDLSKSSNVGYGASGGLGTQRGPAKSTMRQYQLYRPLSVQMQELDKLVAVRPSADVLRGLPGEDLTEEQMSELRQEALEAQKKAQELRESLTESLEKPALEQEQRRYEPALPEPEKHRERFVPEKRAEDKDKGKDTVQQEPTKMLRERMEEQMKDELQRHLEKRAVEAEQQQEQKKQAEAEAKKARIVKGREVIKEFFKGEAGEIEGILGPVPEGGKGVKGGGEFGGLRMPAADFVQYKFKGYIAAAKEYMKEGKFYRAADAYSLASIYMPDDAWAYAGKAFALFAAGEYMSSAFFLARAIETSPDFLKTKVELLEVIGDKDKLENRTLDLARWQNATKAPELSFLIAYILFESGKQMPAEQMMDQAAEKMPDSLAVTRLKETIYKAGGGSL